MPELDRWEKLKRLGEGGQGEVFLVRSPERSAARRNAKRQILPKVMSLLNLARTVGNVNVSGQTEFDGDSEKLLDAIAEYNRPDTPAELGALKVFKIPSEDKGEEGRAVGRLESEIDALSKLKHPAVLKLLYASWGERFIVTEYHPEGTLDKHLDRYKGNALLALEAFRKLVEGVMEIHKKDAIHRDIKPENIFVSAAGDLVLGDFGIVFFQGTGDRLTTTFERVGSHYWMAPWAYENARLELNQVKPALDIYPLGVTGHGCCLQRSHSISRRNYRIAPLPRSIVT